jgi:hypothetical protein
MKTFITLAVAALIGLGAIGCNKPQAGTETKTTKTTPEGSTTTTTEQKTESSGKNPPPAENK